MSRWPTASLGRPWIPLSVGDRRGLRERGSKLEAVGVKGWQVVFRGERIQADLVAAVLESDGLRVEVFGDHAYGVGISLTDARVLVPDDQAAMARELIAQADAARPAPGTWEEPEV